MLVNSPPPDVIIQSLLTLVQVIAWCLRTPSHNLISVSLLSTISGRKHCGTVVVGMLLMIFIIAITNNWKFWFIITATMHRKFSWWLAMCLTPSHYLNQCWLIILQLYEKKKSVKFESKHIKMPWRYQPFCLGHDMLLTHCGWVMIYGDIVMGQLWLR